MPSVVQRVFDASSSADYKDPSWDVDCTSAAIVWVCDDAPRVGAAFVALASCRMASAKAGPASRTFARCGLRVGIGDCALRVGS